MPEPRIYPVPEGLAADAHIDAARYAELYRQSVTEPDAFWAEQAEQYLEWFRPWDEVQSWDYHRAEIRWFKGAKLNVAWNCLDRHLETRADQTAIIWEGDDPAESRHISYRELHQQVCRFAQALKGIGVKKGDRVCLYLPMIPEAAVAMLACARIGAIHSIVFGGFSPDALRERIEDSGCSVVITADRGIRGGRHVPLKANADKACRDSASVKRLVVVQRSGESIDWQEGRDLWYHELLQGAQSDCPAVEMDAEDPLFILYTSGSTAAPKGVLHTSGGYLLYCAMTHRHVFDYRDGEVYWCAADIGWITGHSYLIYGPLANGATTVMFEGTPMYPDAGRIWQIIDKHEVNSFYTAPTAIRALMAHGSEPVERSRRNSLRVLGTVGEPINPEAWQWYYDVVGGGRCPIVDTFWQTETGGILISPLPGATTLKPGCASQPYFGIVPELVDDEGNLLEGEAEGNLVLSRPWPGQMRGVYNDEERFRETYFSQFPGYYSTGDGARRDADGDWWITGRTDDVLNVAGHRLGTAEIESALVVHPAVAEAAVVGFRHDTRGEGIQAYVSLMRGIDGSDELAESLRETVRDEIGSFAEPDRIQWAPSLPKTRSGKIMRRILKRIANDDIDNLGDISTLADPGVVDHILEQRETSA